MMSSSEMESSSIEIVPETIFDSSPLISSVTPAMSAEMFDSATGADWMIQPSGSEMFDSATVADWVVPLSGSEMSDGRSADFGSLVPEKSVGVGDCEISPSAVMRMYGSLVPEPPSADSLMMVPDTPPSPGENLEQIVADLLPTDDAYFLVSEVLKFRRKRKVEEAMEHAGIRRTRTPRAC